MSLLVVTGTDTGVGKTIVTASLAKLLKERGINVAVRKSFASGVTADSSFRDDDALLLRAASASSEPLEAIRPATFQAPLAPLSAAQLESQAVDLETVLANIRARAATASVTLVEGVGGVAVPLTEQVLFSDFAWSLGAPTLLVARSALGTVNHTLLSIEHLRARGITLAGVVFVRSAPGPLTLAEETGPPLAAQIAHVRNFGMVEFSPAVDAATSLEEAANALPSDAPAIREIADWLMGHGVVNLSA